ncbi:MAG: I78 family peptidase inhibitor [Ramlibacter sp.]|nr:I78 family peptidase inhibitor [Ramlibacter sp.]
MLFATAFALIAGCAGAAPAAGGACNADRARFAAGQLLTADLEREARLRSGAATVRVIRPGQMVTLEYNEQRLNIEVDAAGRVTRVRCG